MTSQELQIEIEKIRARERAGELISASDGYRLIAYLHEYAQIFRQEERDKRIAEGKDPGELPPFIPNPVVPVMHGKKE
jgi:hypothetical protein